MRETDGGYDPHSDPELRALLARRRSKVARRSLILKAVACGGLLVVSAAAAGSLIVKANRDRETKSELVRTEQAKAATAKARQSIASPAASEPPGPTSPPRPAPRPKPGTATRPPVASPGRPSGATPGPPAPGVAPPPVSVAPAPSPADLFPERPPEPTPALDKPKEPKESYKSDRPAKEVFAGYYQRNAQKFTVYVSRFAYEKSDELDGEPLQIVTDELNRIVELFPESALKVLRKTPVWVEWDHTIPRSVNAFAVYYGDTGHERWAEGVDPRKAGCVCVLSLKTAHALKAKRNQRQNTLLHEFAHVIHSTAFSIDNPMIANAYEQAYARKLYQKVRHDDGVVRTAYANTNAAEYFAELTCAYLDRLDYLPHDAAELKEHDSVGYEIMTKAYGTPEQIAAAKKKEAAKKK